LCKRSVDGSPKIDDSFTNETTYQSQSKKRRASKSPEANNSTKLTSVQKEKLNIIVAKFFFGCNIPFACADSALFKNMIRELRPEYQAPCARTLSKGLLDKLHDQFMEDSKFPVKNYGTLMLDGWKNSSNNSKEVAATIKPRKGREIFIGSYDFTDKSENQNTLRDIMCVAANQSETLFNIEVDSVCTDNVYSMRAAARDTNFVNYGCKAHVGDLMLGDMANKTLKSEVREIVVCFRKPSLQERILQLGGSHIYYAGTTRLVSLKNIIYKVITNSFFLQMERRKGGIRMFNSKFIVHENCISMLKHRRSSSGS
jgi:hypothetical protein